ncbi:MAG: AGE family epimerase/isomerase [Promethearchaeota archaeon]
MIEAKVQLKKYRDELLNSVIPFWEDHCIDTGCGGYFTFLDRDGSVYDTSKYMWMQWRVVYMFATLAEHDLAGENRSRWIDIAKHGYDFLTAHGKSETGSYYFALNRDGKPMIAPHNIYSEAFATMGSAALYKATREEIYADEATSAMKNYLSRLDDPKGKWNKRLDGAPKRLGHGVYMILANLGAVLEECLGITDYMRQVESSIDMVMNHFWNEDFGVIFENINEDFTFDLDSCDGRHINPGHGLESAWFVLDHASRRGDPALIDKACRIIISLLDFGWDEDHGGIYYFMDVLGKPHVELSWDMKLWWVHAEALVATLKAFELKRDPAYLDWFERIENWTWSRFPDPAFGEWYGYLNHRGEPTHSLKGGRWKTFFHLPRYLLKCIDLFEKIS